jgi:multicomponent Na+:H+ antiporter subunit E
VKVVAIRFTLLFGVWLLWSGHTEPLLIAFGLASCALTLWLTMRMYKRGDIHPTNSLGWRPLTYLPWLVWEIIKSNLDVSRIVLSPKMAISPRLIRVPSSQTSETGQAIFANSITLTPGTITLDLRQGEALVHALTAEAAEGLLAGEMNRRVAALERKP